MKALSKAPGDRYPSVRAYSEAFSLAAQDCDKGGNATPLVEEAKGGLMGKMRGLFGRG